MLSVSFVGLAGLSGVAPANARPVAPAAKTIAFSIPAQPLSSAIGAFIRATGWQITYPSELAQGKTANEVVGTMSPAQALHQLVAGTGINVRIGGVSSAALIDASNPIATAFRAQADAVQLDTITVDGASSRSLQSEGKAADGYKVKSVSAIGALGRRALVDTPFSVSVVPQELIQNTMAMSPDDVFKINPFTRSIAPQGAGWTPVVMIRGFTTSERAEDGLRRTVNFAQVLEDKERIEILNGLSGFMYGAASPAGMVNYVYKRPTVERLNKLTGGNYGGNQYYVHGDFGGRVDEGGLLGYRLNIVKQDGGTPIDYQKINRLLVSGAVDFQVTDKLLVEFNGVYNNYKTTSPNSYWFHQVNHFVVPDPARNWSQRWIRDEFDAMNLIAKATYTLNDHITFRASGARADVARPVQDHTMNSVTGPGIFTQLRQRAGYTKFRDEAGQLMADVTFDMGPLSHKVTTGYYTYSSRTYQTTYAPNTGYIGPYSMAAPTFVPEVAFAVNTSTQPYYQSKAQNENFLIGDEIKFGQWSLLLGGNRSKITTRAYTATGARLQADYDKSYNAPSISLMYKPLPWATIYGTYIEGLEMGGRAPTSATNANNIMPPMISTQKEIGVKAELGGVLYTTAFFDIEKAYEFLDSSATYNQDGRQRHKGFEFSATGKIIPEVTVVGGVTVIDPQIKGGTFNGLQPINVANFTAKLYSEYAIPYVPGLTFTAGVFYTGQQWGNTVNTDRLPSYTTLDLGARYETVVMQHPLALRVNATNVTNKWYWQNTYYLGAPRTVAFSATVQF